MRERERGACIRERRSALERGVSVSSVGIGVSERFR